ncbi:MAG: hypothetical protein Q8M76_03100 [Spirochaetaceae bacterium]|nr:hypothetical protein [Spirochaetaceae bacterium]
MTNSRKSSIVAIVALFALAALPSFAATTGTIALTGSVTGITEISVDLTGATSSFDLTATASDVLIGTLTERSNRPLGYTVTLASAKGWKFASPDAGMDDSVPFSLKYGVAGSEAALTLSGSPVTITSASNKTSAAGVAKRLLISYTGGFYEESATYSDTLTFTIIAN